jgi:hypothetical protein
LNVSPALSLVSRLGVPCNEGGFRSLRISQMSLQRAREERLYLSSEMAGVLLISSKIKGLELLKEFGKRLLRMWQLGVSA